MKKNNIAIDIINFGEESINEEKLSSFINTVNRENSHLITIPPGPYLLYEEVSKSPIISDDAGFGNADLNDNDDLFDFGPGADPELALALRLSLEDEKIRVEKEKANKEKIKDSNLENIAEETGESSGSKKD